MELIIIMLALFVVILYAYWKSTEDWMREIEGHHREVNKQLKETLEQIDEHAELEHSGGLSAEQMRELREQMK